MLKRYTGREIETRLINKISLQMKRIIQKITIMMIKRMEPRLRMKMMTTITKVIQTCRFHKNLMEDQETETKNLKALRRNKRQE